MHDDIIEKYGHVFDKPTIGLTVRRGDFIELKIPILSECQLRKLVNKIISDRHGFVKIVLSSDNIPWCKDALQDCKDVFFVDDAPEN